MNKDIKDIIFSLLLVLIVIVSLFVFAWCGFQLNHKSKLLQVAQDELTSITENIQFEYIKSEHLAAELSLAINELNDAKETILALKSIEYELVYVGEFKITYYCDSRYHHICGGNGITASGQSTEVGWTAAADWNVLPNGSVVYIEGIGFREIQDVGGAVNNNHIDVLVHNHQEALDLGLHHEGVWLLVEKSS